MSSASPPDWRRECIRQDTLAGDDHPRPLGTTRDRELGARTGGGDPLGGALAPGEVVDEHIALIEAVNPRLNAIVATRFEAARAEADAADELRRGRGPGRASCRRCSGCRARSRSRSRVAGMPHTSGSLARADVVAEHSATAVQRLVDAGAIPLGVTNTSELTLWIESQNPVWGRTNNAYDPRPHRRRLVRGRRRRDRLRLRPDRPRHRHRRLDPPAGLLQRRVRPQADGRPGPPHRPLPVPKRARLGDARHRARWPAAPRT